MDVVLHKAFLFDAYLTAFIGILAISGTIINARKRSNSNSRNIFTRIFCAILICVWGYFIVYSRFYPISVACYEYNHQHSLKTTGIIDNVEIPGNSHIEISIDDKTYTMVYSDINPYQKLLGKEIKEGDLVQIQFGERSMYIFDICKIENKTGDGLREP